MNLNYECIKENEYRKFISGKQADEWGTKIYEDWAKRMKENEKIKIHAGLFNVGKNVFKPIEFYCANGYKLINEYLRNGICVDEEIKMCAYKISEELIFAPRVPENIISYRYVENQFIKELFNSKEKDEKFWNGGFTSVSLIKEIYKCAPEGTSLLKVYVPKGMIGVYVNPLVQRNENELLLQNNTNLRLCEKPYFDEEINGWIYGCEISSIINV